MLKKFLQGFIKPIQKSIGYSNSLVKIKQETIKNTQKKLLNIQQIIEHKLLSDLTLILFKPQSLLLSSAMLNTSMALMKQIFVTQITTSIENIDTIGQVNFKHTGFDLMLDCLGLHHTKCILNQPEYLHAILLSIFDKLNAGGLYTGAYIQTTSLQYLPSCFKTHCLDMHDLGDALINTGFKNPVLYCEPMQVACTSFTEYLYCLKQFGFFKRIDTNQTNQIEDYQAGKSFKNSKTLYLALKKAYEASPNLDLEIAYIHAWKPDQYQLDGFQQINIDSLFRR